jgi:hypothetical protein
MSVWKSGIWQEMQDPEISCTQFHKRLRTRIPLSGRMKSWFAGSFAGERINRPRKNAGLEKKAALSA